MIEIRTGSDSDIVRIKEVYTTLDTLSVSYCPRVLSAHRNPEKMAAEASALSQNGFRVCIAAAGGSAHLPGMTASETVLPVIGIPVWTPTYDGKDAFFSIVQMPEGVPVGATGLKQSASAGFAAAQIACLFEADKRKQIRSNRGLSSSFTLPDKNALRVAIIQSKGFKGDREKYGKMIELLDQFGISSAVFENYDSEAAAEIEKQGFFSIIALHDLGSDEAGSLTIARQTDLPVIALPVANKSYGGDALPGEALFQLAHHEQSPVMIMGINRYQNAALFAAQIIGAHISSIQKALLDYREKLKEHSNNQDGKLMEQGVRSYWEDK